MPKRPQAGSAAAGSDADAKKAKPHVQVCTLTVTMPHNTEPESPKLDAKNESKRAARQAKDKATRVERYGHSDFAKFATPFAAAVASASAKFDRPVTLVEVITEMTDATGKVKIGKHLKERFAWAGFTQGRWQISRVLRAGSDPVAYPKGTAMPSRTKRKSPPAPFTDETYGLPK